MSRTPLHIARQKLHNLRRRYRVAGKTKYFCIGRNKTGTTSIKKAFEDLGYIVGNQRQAEILYDKHYFQNNFAPLLNSYTIGGVDPYQKFVAFLDITSTQTDFPWENRT